MLLFCCTIHCPSSSSSVNLAFFVDYNEHDVTEDEEASSGCVCDSPFLCAGGALNYVKRKNGRGGKKRKKKERRKGEERGKR